MYCASDVTRCDDGARRRYRAAGQHNMAVVTIEDLRFTAVRMSCKAS
ncbi:hypothetical protein KCP74_09290 [Salmonella enterica subsp. enterica]|nr:hypothetical protein KCP74_09290 [Salmonella enterica subsp. enterica]